MTQHEDSTYIVWQPSGTIRELCRVSHDKSVVFADDLTIDEAKSVITTQLKILDQASAERYAAYQAWREPRPNGITCPTCGAELVDSDPTLCLTSDPPQTKVYCNSCGYSGSRTS